ncbi:uncharacterized protein [Argopecten irradians]|uniref:uncharacterized protein n=1 Tax=Argopecten irradians TaxID=31199 RepID=UPI00371B8859
MAAFKVLLSFMLVCTTSCQEQSVPPVDLSAVYIADGTIIVTWDSPDVLPGLRISQYFVMVTEAGKSTDFDYLSPDIYVYRFSDIKPDTAYTIKVSTLINGIVSGSVMVNITTDPATYISEGDITRLMLPKPPNTAISVVALNTRTLYQFLYGEIDGDNTTEDGVSVRLASEYAELEIDSTHVTHAGYYYTKIISGDIVLGGTLIVVTDTPTVPTITSSETLPLVNETVDLECASSVSRSKPDNHGLRMTSTWKLNGSSITDTRFNVKDTSLVITPVLMRDRYNMFTCQTREATEGYSGPPSEDSAEFVLKPRFPARITKLRYQNETEELRPVIPNDVIRLHEADSLVLNVEVDSNPNPNVTLIRHNHVITWTDINGVTGGYDLVLDNLQCDDTGTYDVIASNAVTQNPSEIRFGLQVTCTPRRRYSCDSIIRLTGKRGQAIPLDAIVIANPSPTIRWSTGVMDTSIVQNNSYTYTVQGSVLITSAEGYIHSHVNISNGVGKMLTVTFKIRTEGIV